MQMFPGSKFRLHSAAVCIRVLAQVIRLCERLASVVSPL